MISEKQTEKRLALIDMGVDHLSAPRCLAITQSDVGFVVNSEGSWHDTDQSAYQHVNRNQTCKPTSSSLLQQIPTQEKLQINKTQPN